MIKVILWMFLTMLTACSSTPEPQLPQSFEQIHVADKEARRAMKSGDLLRARQAFLNLLQLQQSLDDTAGAGTTIINLATISHQLKDDKDALNWLDKILLERTDLFQKSSRIDASFRKAVILTNLMRLPEAELSLHESEKLCDKSCSIQLGIMDLNARILLLNDKTQEALVLALSVSKAADIPQDELANSLRTAASAEAKLGLNTESLVHFQNALKIDKALGLSARIVEDLEGMVLVSKSLGREQDATNFSRRAELVKKSFQPEQNM